MFEDVKAQRDNVNSSLTQESTSAVLSGRVAGGGGLVFWVWLAHVALALAVGSIEYSSCIPGATLCLSTGDLERGMQGSRGQ